MDDGPRAGYLTYEAWKKGLNHASWRHVGEWAFPRKTNSGYSDVFYHWCREAMPLRGVGMYTGLNDTGCGLCGTPVPDGIKMIALLEKL